MSDPYCDLAECSGGKRHIHIHHTYPQQTRALWSIDRPDDPRIVLAPSIRLRMFGLWFLRPRHRYRQLVGEGIASLQGHAGDLTAPPAAIVSEFMIVLPVNVGAHACVLYNVVIPTSCPPCLLSLILVSCTVPTVPDQVIANRRV
jgi:hypothetical protein